jgi:hypothetical protein
MATQSCFVNHIIRKKVLKAKRHKSKDADTRAAEAELTEALGLGVEIKKGKGEKGELRIRYTTLDQLEDVRRRLCRGNRLHSNNTCSSNCAAKDNRQGNTALELAVASRLSETYLNRLQSQWPRN